MREKFSSSRRNLLINAGSLATALQLPSSVLYAEPSISKFKLEFLDKQIIERVKKTDRRGKDLSLYCNLKVH